MRPPFLVQAGPGSHKEYQIGNGLTLGRLPSNTIPLEDPQASRNHAQILWRNGQAVVRDLNSANGTVVNGERIAGERPLRSGDSITIGDTTFLYYNDLEQARPRLVAIGAAQGEYPIRGTVTVGRIPGNTIVVPEGKVSRHHAEIYFKGSQVVLHDLDSLNGTLLNGMLVVGERPLHDGDIIGFGDTGYTYHNDLEKAA
jgi:pSer/pThr/pTyr-binding forkhead associated (FHA) protein